MTGYIKNGFGDVTYTKVVVILADNPIEGYDNTYYISEYKMYLKTHSVTINISIGTVLGNSKLHDNLVNEISGNAPISIALCAQATFENGKMRSDAVNWEILSKEQLDYINRMVEESAPNGASSKQECKFWAEKIIRDMSEKTSAINISCLNYNDYVDWFSGSILFSFPNIACSFRIDVPVDNLKYSVDDIVYIADFLHHNMLASGLADVARDGEIFAIAIESDHQEVSYLEDNDDELLYRTVGDWKQNLPQLFKLIADLL